MRALRKSALVRLVSSVTSSLLFGLFASSLLFGCSSSSRDMGFARKPGPRATPRPLASSRPDIVVPSPREHDPLWLEARDEDPLYRTRLAIAVGASGLLDGVKDGGMTERTALLALPEADDAELALGPLAAMARAALPPRRALLLATILAVAGRPLDSREPLDPDGMRAAARTVLSMALDSAIPKAERALAISAARAFAERGLVDPAKIPTDLDPK